MRNESDRKGPALPGLLLGALSCGPAPTIRPHARASRSRNHPPGNRAARRGPPDRRARAPRAAPALARAGRPARLVAGQRILHAKRRAKYLLLELESGTLLLHLGMSGSLRVLPADTPRLTHDHFDLVLDSGNTLRFNDPRRFGSLHYTTGDPNEHPLLAKLAPEPLEAAFNAEYLWQTTRGRQGHHQTVADEQQAGGRCRQHLRERGAVPGESAAAPAGTQPHPRRSRAPGRERCVPCWLWRSASAARRLRDYVGADGVPGYFRQKLFVYERASQPCRKCGTPVRQLTQGQRSTYYCPSCQK